MTEIEAAPALEQVRLLFLDTSGGRRAARDFHEAIGYTYAGGNPGHALDQDAPPAKNATYYKELPSSL